MNAVVPRDGGDVSVQPAVLCSTFCVLWLQGGCLWDMCLRWGESVAAVPGGGWSHQLRGGVTGTGLLLNPPVVSARYHCV